MNWATTVVLVGLALIAYLVFRKGRHMTKAEREQWNRNACIPRCLIKLANDNGNPITDDEFAKEIEHLFPNPKTAYGSFNIDGSFFEIVSRLGLPTHRQDSDNYSLLDEHFNVEKHRCILILSKKNLHPAHTDPVMHCSVLTKIDSTLFSVWTPYQDGSDGPINDLDKSVWTAKECFGLMLF